MELLVYDSSSDEEDLFDVILYEIAFTRKPMLGPRLNLQDVSEDDCEKMFRYTTLRYIIEVYLTQTITFPHWYDLCTMIILGSEKKICDAFFKL